MQVILDHFPQITAEQQAQFAQLDELYRLWNARINVISRKDIDHLYTHHVLHSLAIAKFVQFKPEAQIVDLGTGGGFPGIPLAILFPEVSFTLIDGTRKKISVVEAVAEGLGLTNVRPLAVRAEEHKGQYDFVVTRAVAEMSMLARWSAHLVQHKRQLHALPNGLIALKGGQVKQEVKGLPRKMSVETEPISTWFKDPWFEEKYVVWAQV
ncbi:MAG: 16S rRNA (guanine(527)-N(7))-methyltransferase RsmG [Saprospiraceae bacterium]